MPLPPWFLRWSCKGERSKQIGDTTVQRDLYSAFLLSNTDASLEYSDRERCSAGFEKFVKLHDGLIAQMKTSGISRKSCFGFVNLQYVISLWRVLLRGAICKNRPDHFSFWFQKAIFFAKAFFFLVPNAKNYEEIFAIAFFRFAKAFFSTDPFYE